MTTQYKNNSIPSNSLIPCATFEGKSEYKFTEKSGKETTINLNKRIFNNKVEYVWCLINGFPQLVKRSKIKYS